MADFLKALAKTSGHEAGYSRNRHDRGGETWDGISRVKHPEWAGWPIVDRLKKKLPVIPPGFPDNLALDPDLSRLKLAFYQEEFWEPVGGTYISDQAIADELFDTAVNMSPAVAVRFLQRSLNVLNRHEKHYPDLRVDGKIGPATLGSLALLPASDLALLYKMLNVLQGHRYFEIMEADPIQEEFCRGWFERVEKV